MKYKKIQLQRDINIIALDYLKIAEVDSLEKLKETPYWSYYQTEVKRVQSQTIQKMDNNLKKEQQKLNCSKCKELLGVKIDNKFLIEDNFKFSNDTIVLKITCNCGVENNFKVKKIEEDHQQKLIG